MVACILNLAKVKKAVLYLVQKVPLSETPGLRYWMICLYDRGPKTSNNNNNKKKMIIIIVVSPGFAQGFKQSNIYSVGTVLHIVPSAYEHRQFIKCIFIKTSYWSREAPPLLLYQLLKSSSIWPLSQHSPHKQSPQDRDGCAEAPAHE